MSIIGISGGELYTEAASLVSLLREKGLRVTAAESCTGGLFGASVTSVSGSSEVFDGSIVTYANRIKREFLGVPEDVLETVGAVSEETARAMVTGVKRLFSADCAAAITGIAGPGGGTPEKPVGTVWISSAYGDEVRAEKCLFPGDRDSVREQSVIHAMRMLKEMIIGEKC